jgi:hypothetical protein
MIGGWVCLLSYFLVWIGGAQGLTLLFLAAGHSHKAFLSESHNHVHLVLHHPGVQDQHEAPGTSPLTHQRDLLDRVLAEASGSAPEEDHVVRVPEQKEPFVAATKIISPSKDASPLVIVQTWPMIVRPRSVHLFPDSPPRFNPILVALRTTLLVI